MEQNEKQEKQTPPAKKGMSDFRKGLLWTVIPLLAVGIIRFIGIPVFVLNWIVVFGLWIVALIIAIVFGIVGRRKLASGMFVGLGLAFVVLGATCFTAPLLNR